MWTHTRYNLEQNSEHNVGGERERERGKKIEKGWKREREMHNLKAPQVPELS